MPVETPSAWLDRTKVYQMPDMRGWLRQNVDSRNEAAVQRTLDSISKHVANGLQIIAKLGGNETNVYGDLLQVIEIRHQITLLNQMVATELKRWRQREEQQQKNERDGEMPGSPPLVMRPRPRPGFPPATIALYEPHDEIKEEDAPLEEQLQPTATDKPDGRVA